ncbi:transposase [candidate division TA06 bacterium]|uniref:Transposase n=1 Tax=candidate division TA06 bacterium TaxID=2250710 RepID=A0A933IDM8_UNCT6|nr:transposase [candidate division TA06 bacterium]
MPWDTFSLPENTHFVQINTLNVSSAIPWRYCETGANLTSLSFTATGQIPWPKGGNKIGYSGHKHQRGEKELTIVDNMGNIIGPVTVRPVNEHDTTLLPEILKKVVTTSKQLGLDLTDSYLTLDAGFDGQENKDLIRQNFLLPVIRPNIRNNKNPEKIRFLFDEFSSVQHIYRERHRIEHCFAWADTYRKLVIRYEKLHVIHLGFRYLAYSMINLQWFIGKQ